MRIDLQCPLDSFAEGRCTAGTKSLTKARSYELCTELQKLHVEGALKTSFCTLFQNIKVVS